MVRPSVGPGNVFQRIVERLTTPQLEPCCDDCAPNHRLHISLGIEVVARRKTGRRRGLLTSRPAASTFRRRHGLLATLSRVGRSLMSRPCFLFLPLALGLAPIVLAACGGQGLESGVSATPTPTVQTTPTAAGTRLEEQAELCKFSGSYSEDWYMLCSVYDGVYDFLFVVRGVGTPDEARAAKAKFERWVRDARRIEDPCGLKVHIVYPNSFYAQMGPDDYRLDGCGP